MSERKPYGYVVAAIENYLRDFGPITPSELADALGCSRYTTSSVLHRMRTGSPKRVYITDWIYDSEGARRYPRPRYALGSSPDAKRPTPNRKAVRRQSVQNRRNRLRTNFVFNLGASTHVR